jgi:ATP-dependent Clp protease adapter protein ClpS
MKKIIVLNDDMTPMTFVIEALHEVLGLTEVEANRVVKAAHETGRGDCGTYAEDEVEGLVAKLKKYIDSSGFPLKVELHQADLPEAVSANDSENATPKLVCSFCKKSSDKVETLLAGPGVNICNECVDLSLEAIREKNSDSHFKHTYELLNWHFSGLRNEEIVTASRSFMARVRADLQLAINILLEEQSPVRFVGVHGSYGNDSLDIPNLLEKGQRAKLVGPLQYEDVDIGESEPVKCLKNGLWLFEEGGIRYVILLSKHQDMYGQQSINVEFAAPAGDDATIIGQQFFRLLEQAVNNAQSYRGKVLSLEQNRWYNGMSSGITVHKLRQVNRDEIILPKATLELLERNIISFAQKRAQLKTMNMSGKKGVLFYGPPGTGKTHTVHFLAHHLPEHTTLLITAEQVGIIKEYFMLARLLQPSIVVIEDVDLIARDRTTMNSPCEEALLNTLLNEMDGLKEDAEIFFVLTTNRPEMLETALAARPGRIDQAIEFPLPDQSGREKLIYLYAGNLKLSTNIVDSIATRTEGVSAAFIKELMRRASQYYLDDKGSTELSGRHIDEALQEMLFSGGRLNVKLLGGNEAMGEPGN